MASPHLVQHWLSLRREYERQFEQNARPSMPRVLPIVKIRRTWYFVDERLQEYRNVLEPSDRLPLSIEKYVEHVLQDRGSQG